MTLFRKRSVKSDPQMEYQCTIRFLDDSEPIQLSFKKDTLGHVLFEQVCNKLNLMEKDYFGLRYVDSEKQRHWLDPLKSVYKQLKGVNPTVLCFRVKFYPADPMKLREEITRYYLFLQLRRDLHHGRLLCSPADANLLAAYIIQSEVGDYEAEDHPPGYVTEFKMLPKQNPKTEEQIMELHKTLSGQVPAEAEGNFLKKAASLDTYGVDPHQVKDHKGTQFYLGVTHQGIMTFYGSRRTQLYKWNQIRRIAYEGKMFIVHVSIAEDEDTTNTKKAQTMDSYLCTNAGNMDEDKQQPIGYKCQTVGACKYLWRCAVEQQLFFTLPNSDNPPKLRSGGSLFSRGSKFRFSGKCQNEAYSNSDGINRNEPAFSRSSSLPNFGRKSDSKASLKNSSVLADTVKEDKKRYQESAVDVEGLDTNVETIPISPIVKAPVAVEEDVTIVETIEAVQATVQQSPVKVNGVIPSLVSPEAAEDELPIYEPNLSLIEDEIIEDRKDKDEVDQQEEEDSAPKMSLDEQIRSLEEEILRKDSFSKTNNHVEAEVSGPVLTETVEPQMNNKVGSAPPSSQAVDSSLTNHSQATPDSPVVPKKSGPSCCAMFMFTLVFIVLTLAIVAIVIYNSNINHPIAKQLKQQMKFVEPVRDYISHRVQSIFKS
ncbi:FERM domain-containing protein 5-like isoform X3 [Mizuhopecten yessoensis]|uniref:FERM domain-containing protein 5-like isoform X3 n=1 Tax=Mizuhopecten yessoensis TaxID=6573 RepID=UPI000B45C500|nr:FERM domain-containing protein 5-like isoform X3 [Mizuhopecten yessoensis]